MRWERWASYSSGKVAVNVVVLVRYVIVDGRIRLGDLGLEALPVDRAREDSTMDSTR